MMPILRSGQRHMNQKSSGMGDDGWLDVVGLLADCFCFGRTPRSNPRKPCW